MAPATLHGAATLPILRGAATLRAYAALRAKGTLRGTSRIEYPIVQQSFPFLYNLLKIFPILCPYYQTK